MPSRQATANESRKVTLGEGFELAVKSLENGQLEQAHRICCQILGSVPDHPRTLLLRSAVEAEQGRFDAAERTVGRIIELRPDDPDARHHRNQIRQQREESLDHPYVRNFLGNRAVYMDYPRNIGIETVGRCNAKCRFCPQGELKRRHTAMPDDLFEKIIRDLQEIPTEIPTRIAPNMVNEPFMDKKMFARLRRINEALPTTRLAIFTNFNVLPRGFMDEFRRLRNLEVLNVSFNAANASDYRNVMGIDFARTIRHLKAFMAENRGRRFLEEPVVLSRVAAHTRADDDYEEQCRGLFAEFEEGVDYVVHLKNRTNWLGATEDKQSPIPYSLPCGAWFDINIMCTGVVPLCCIDSKGEHIIGDVTRNTVLDVYNNPDFKSLRQNEVSRESTDPCGNCSLVQ
jgi:hypothetical protein